MPQTPRTIYLINEVNLAVRTRMERALREMDLTVAQYVAMSLLAGRDKISSAKLARARRVSPQTINELIVGMEARGMVTRLGDPDNRRELLVSLTKAGRDRLKIADAAVDEIERDVLADLDAATLQKLRATCDVLIGTIRRTDAG